MADFHLRSSPGTRRLVPRRAASPCSCRRTSSTTTSLAEHATGADAVLRRASRDVAVADYARALRRRRGADPRRRPAHRRARLSVSVFEDLGVQQGAEQHARAPTSTSCCGSLTGNFAKPGGDAPALVDARRSLGYDTRERRTPVTGAPIIGGLMPCNVIPDEILTDHPDRFRAMLVESSQPGALARRLARACARRCEALDLRRRDRRRDDRDGAPRRLRAARRAASSRSARRRSSTSSSRDNTFHLRHPLLEPLPGTLPEPEIHARLVRALGVVDDAALEPLRAAAARGPRRVRRGVRRGGRRGPARSAARAVRPLRDARADAARRAAAAPPRCGASRSAAR